jgi:O-acetyl-ADP-ribose deacetylase (regulator of RNase III)
MNHFYTLTERINMLRKVQNKDIFQGNHDLVFIPVNTMGVMGAGLALQFKKKYPMFFVEYKEFCKRIDIQQWMSISYAIPTSFLYFPTKDHWSNDSNLETILETLHTFLLELRYYLEFTDIGVPKLGCGLGGLDENEVIPSLMDAFQNFCEDTGKSVTFYI